MSKNILKKEEIEPIPLDYFEIQDPLYGKRFFVRQDDGYIEVTKPQKEPIRTHIDRIHQMDNIESFVAYIKKYGDSKTGIIFCSSEAVTMFFDALNRIEKVILPVSLSLELKSFLGNGQNKTFGQKELVKTIETFPEAILATERILSTLSNLKADIQIDFEANIDPHNYTLIYQEKAGKQTTQIPKQIILTIPYFEGSEPIKIVTDLEISIPKSAEERIWFELSDPKAHRTRRDALQKDIAKLKTELKEWIFVFGK